MKTIWMALPAVFLTAVLPNGLADEREEKPFSRSLYVPVVFAVSPDLGEASMTVVGEDVAFSPQPRTFLFTYFSQHDKILPERVEVRVEPKVACPTGEKVLSFFVEPFAIKSGDESFAASKKELLRLNRSRSRDLRLSTRVITLRCPDPEES